MVRAFVGLALAASIASALEPPPSFPSRIDLVTVDVVVLDDQGRPLSGLRREDFTLAEDGRPQEVVSFEAFRGGHSPADAAPDRAVPQGGAGPRAGARTFVLLVDDVSLAPYRQEAVPKALGRFLDDGLGAGDEVLFATTSGDAWWSARLPEGRDDLLALLGRIRGRRLADDGRDAISDIEAFRMVHLEGAGGRTSVNSDGTPPPPGPPARPRLQAPAGTDTTGALLARREFAPGRDLYCHFQVFGAKASPGGPRVLASYELRRPSGEVVRRAEPTPIEPRPDGGLMRLLTLPLLGQAAGDYELVLRVLDQSTGETREAVEALRLVSSPGS